MALEDCDPPVIPTPSLSNTDYIDRLSLLWGNLVRFNRFTVAGGASLVEPFTDPPVTGAEGAQKKAIAMPGGSATVQAIIADLAYGAALTGMNGGAYNMSFDAWLEGGGTSADLSARFLDSTGNPLSNSSFANPIFNDAADGFAWVVTNVPTTYKWEYIASDDPDWFAVQPNNAVFDFFVTGASDIPAGSTLYITNFQLQLNDFFAPFPIHLPWRPARGEPDLIQYAEYILQTNFDEIIAKPNYKVMSSPNTQNLYLAPSGVARYIPISATSYALGDTIIPPGVYLRCENAGLTTITFTDEATHGFPPLSVISIRAQGAGGFVVSEDPGVTVNPNLSGVTGSSGQGDLVQYLYLGGEQWDAI